MSLFLSTNVVAKQPLPLTAATRACQKVQRATFVSTKQNGIKNVVRCNAAAPEGMLFCESVESGCHGRGWACS